MLGDSVSNFMSKHCRDAIIGSGDVKHLGENEDFIACQRCQYWVRVKPVQGSMDRPGRTNALASSELMTRTVQSNPSIPVACGLRRSRMRATRLERSSCGGRTSPAYSRSTRRSCSVAMLFTYSSLTMLKRRRPDTSTAKARQISESFHAGNARIPVSRLLM